MSHDSPVWQDLRDRVRFAPKEYVLGLAVHLARRVPGNIVEFGVAEGDSTRILKKALGRSNKKIFACDSFKGLNEKFENAEVGAFACTPPRIQGVEIVEGYFEDSLSPDLAKRVGRVAFASLDADLFSSTLCALNWLTPLLGSGSLLLFDEFLGEKQSEKRAFETWSQETGIRTVQIAEFSRKPSGWGDQLDSRPLFQVIGDEPLPQGVGRNFREQFLDSKFGKFARKARNLIRGR